MAYGDELYIGTTIHIEGADGGPLCGGSPYRDRGNNKYSRCLTCGRIHEENNDLLARWNDGKGVEGSKPIEDKLVWDGSNPVESQPDYTPGQSWDWNSAPGFDKNRNRKRR